MKHLGLLITLGFILGGLAPLAEAQSDITAFTATSKHQRVVLRWQNPVSPPFGKVRLVVRTDRFANDVADVGSGTFSDVGGSLGAVVSIEQHPLSIGTTYYFSAFVDDGMGTFSAGKHVDATPLDAAGPVKWTFKPADSAISMAPPGIGPVVLAVNNNGFLYAMERGRGANGGTVPLGFTPYQMPAPVQHRPSVIPISGLTSANAFALLSSSDGHVRAIDAETGAELWESADVGVVVAAPAGWFQNYGASADYVLVGSRNSGVDNVFYALNASNGQTAWMFDDPAGAGVGIVSGGATVDYARGLVYFTSHERSPGADTVWALDLASGAKAWSRPLGNVSSSAIFRGSVLYVASDDGVVHALEVLTGDDASGSFDTGDGMTRGFPFPEFGGNRLYLTTGSRVWALRDISNMLEDRWSHASIPGPSNALYPGGDYLWTGSSDGSLYQLMVFSGNPSTDPLTSSLPLSTSSLGSPSYDVASILVYVGAEDGTIYAVAPF